MFLLTSSCSAGNEGAKYEIFINGKVLYAELALSAEEREHGLMFRKLLKKNSGMLFVFPHDRRLSFWMKNTMIPLSIAYISSDNTVREIKDMKPYSLKPVSSKYSVRFALEMERGYFEENNIAAGDTVIFSDTILQVLEKAGD